MDDAKKSILKKKILHETRMLFFLTVYLALFLISLIIYRSLILNENIFSFFHVGYVLIEAIVLAKIILLGKMFHLGEKYEDKPLIISSIYMAVVFSIFVFIFSIFEHFLLGFIEGKEMAVIFKELASHSLNQNMGKLLITFLVFILLFSFLQVGRVFGEDKLFKLFFYRNKDL